MRPGPVTELTKMNRLRTNATLTKSSGPRNLLTSISSSLECSGTWSETWASLSCQHQRSSELPRCSLSLLLATTSTQTPAKSRSIESSLKRYGSIVSPGESEVSLDQRIALSSTKTFLRRSTLPSPKFRSRNRKWMVRQCLTTSSIQTPKPGNCGPQRNGSLPRDSSSLSYSSQHLTPLGQSTSSTKSPI